MGDRLGGCWIAELAGWRSGWSAGSEFVVVGQLFDGRLADVRLVGWGLAGLLAGWRVGQRAGWMVSWIADLLANWLNGALVRLVGELAGWFWSVAWLASWRMLGLRYGLR